MGTGCLWMHNHIVFVLQQKFSRGILVRIVRSIVNPWTQLQLDHQVGKITQENLNYWLLLKLKKGYYIPFNVFHTMEGSGSKYHIFSKSRVNNCKEQILHCYKYYCKLWFREWQQKPFWNHSSNKGYPLVSS